MLCVRDCLSPPCRLRRGSKIHYGKEPACEIDAKNRHSWIAGLVHYRLDWLDPVPATGGPNPPARPGDAGRRIALSGSQGFCRAAEGLERLPGARGVDQERRLSRVFKFKIVSPPGAGLRSICRGGWSAAGHEVFG